MWEESCERNPMWEESHVGGIPCGRNPVWEESHVGGIPWEESRGRNPVGGIAWEESRGRNSAWEESRWNPILYISIANKSTIIE